MQDIIVYIIIFIAIGYTLFSIIKKILFVTTRDSNQSSACNGCSGCSINKSEASCSSLIKQIEKFEHK